MNETVVLRRLAEIMADAAIISAPVFCFSCNIFN